MDQVTEFRVLRPAAACKMLGVGRTTLWKLAQRPDFPQRVTLGARATGWVETELLLWVQGRKEVSK